MATGHVTPGPASRDAGGLTIAALAELRAALRESGVILHLLPVVNGTPGPPRLVTARFPGE